MKCERYNRCNVCLKLNYKLRSKQYQELRRRVIEEAPKDENGALIIPRKQLDSLVRQRLAIGRAYRRWKRGQRA